MGFAISVVIPEIVLQEFEKSLFLVPIPTLKFWGMYVDDTFSIIKNNEIDRFLQKLNEEGNFLKFTKEEKKRVSSFSGYISSQSK